ncbi:hypothetical protein [Marivirga sp.]|uniref:hypothetical protein n=1 Tax=Marivirga sp. TaxID=2018662 RepID=UPI003DA71BCD
MKKIIWIILIVVVIVSLYFYLTHFSLPRYMQFLKATCDLSVPRNVELIHFQEDDYPISGDYYVELILKLDDKALANLTNEAKEKGYEKLPIENLLGGFIYENYSLSDKGLFKVVQKNNNEKTILINQTQGKLIIQVISL